MYLVDQRMGMVRAHSCVREVYIVTVKYFERQICTRRTDHDLRDLGTTGPWVGNMRGDLGATGH